MTRILAIDPGPEESAYTLIDTDEWGGHKPLHPLRHGKMTNHALRWDLRDIGQARSPWLPDRIVIEMVASYGMPVGVEVFTTVRWIGIYEQLCYDGDHAPDAELIPRLPVKLHHCNDSRAKDSNIIQALVDRFAPGQPNRGKGTKDQPGWFHSFAGDVWQSYALAVYAADTEEQ